MSGIISVSSTDEVANTASDSIALKSILPKKTAVAEAEMRSSTAVPRSSSATKERASPVVAEKKSTIQNSAAETSRESCYSRVAKATNATEVSTNMPMVDRA